MTLIRTGELIGAARAGLAFNAITLEHAAGIVDGAEAARSAVIIQVSQNAIRYHGALEPLAAALSAIAAASSVDVALHLDHIDDRDLLERGAAAGFSSVMFDAADLSFEDNVSATRAAAGWAHQRGLWLEAELGFVGGKPGATPLHADDERTDPAEAAAYVDRTGVDALAVAVGSTHKMTERTARLDHDLITRLAAAVDVPLVLHGSSGVPAEELIRAVRGGIAKINVGTALNVAYTAAVREVLAQDPQLSDPRKYLKPARAAVADVVAELLGLIGSHSA